MLVLPASGPLLMQGQRSPQFQKCCTPITPISSRMRATSSCMLRTCPRTSPRGVGQHWIAWCSGRDPRDHGIRGMPLADFLCTLGASQPVTKALIRTHPCGTLPPASASTFGQMRRAHVLAHMGWQRCRGRHQPEASRACALASYASARHCSLSGPHRSARVRVPIDASGTAVVRFSAAAGWQQIVGYGFGRADNRLATCQQRVGNRLATGWQQVRNRLATAWQQVGDRLQVRQVGNRLATGWQRHGVTGALIQVGARQLVACVVSIAAGRRLLGVSPLPAARPSWLEAPPAPCRLPPARLPRCVTARGLPSRHGESLLDLRRRFGLDVRVVLQLPPLPRCVSHQGLRMVLRVVLRLPPLPVAAAPGRRHLVGWAAPGSAPGRVGLSELRQRGALLLRRLPRLVLQRWAWLRSVPSPRWQAVVPLVPELCPQAGHSDLPAAGARPELEWRNAFCTAAPRAFALHGPAG